MAFQPKNNQEKILHRLQIAHGHLEKVLKMVKNQDYCIDILHQSQAVISALEKTNHVILENHLQACVIDEIQAGQTKKTIEEIMGVIRKADE